MQSTHVALNARNIVLVYGLQVSYVDFRQMILTRQSCDQHHTQPLSPPLALEPFTQSNTTVHVKFNLRQCNLQFKLISVVITARPDQTRVHCVVEYRDCRFES